MTTFTLSSSKGTVRFTGMFADAVAAAKNMDYCWEPADGVTVTFRGVTLALVIAGAVERAKNVF